MSAEPRFPCAGVGPLTIFCYLNSCNSAPATALNECSVEWRNLGVALLISRELSGEVSRGALCQHACALSHIWPLNCSLYLIIGRRIAEGFLRRLCLVPPPRAVAAIARPSPERESCEGAMDGSQAEFGPTSPCSHIVSEAAAHRVTARSI